MTADEYEAAEMCAVCILSNNICYFISFNMSTLTSWEKG